MSTDTHTHTHDLVTNTQLTIETALTLFLLSPPPIGLSLIIGLSLLVTVVASLSPEETGLTTDAAEVTEARPTETVDVAAPAPIAARLLGENGGGTCIGTL